MKILWLVLVAGCSSAATTTDASVDVAGDAALDVSDAQPLDVQPLDVQPLDAQPLDAQPVACGTETCSAAQICVSVGGGAGISMTCLDLPAACHGVPTCECLGASCPSDAMHSCSVGERTASCNCTTCP